MSKTKKYIGRLGSRGLYERAVGIGAATLALMVSLIIGARANAEGTSVDFSVIVPTLPVLEIKLYDGAGTSGSEIGGGTKTMSVAPTLTSAGFNSSDVTVSVGTSNDTGYNLKMKTTNNALTSENGTIATLASAGATCTAETAANCNFTVNRWGYKLSTADSYSPVPGTTEETLIYFNEKTNANPTIVNFGARVDTEQPSGIYTTTVQFVATANPVTYSITYDANGSDVTGMPTENPQTGALGSSSTGQPSTHSVETPVTLSSLSPEKTGYTFGGWCDTTLTNGTCGGHTYSAGDTINMSADQSEVTLHAIWTINSYGIKIRTATGIASVSLTDGSSTCTANSSTVVNCSTASGVNLNYGSVLTLTAVPETDYNFGSWSYNPTQGTIASANAVSTTFTVGAGDTTITPSATRKKWTVTVANDAASATSAYTVNFTSGGDTDNCPNVTGVAVGGTASLCQGISYILGMSLTDSNTYAFDSWSAAAGGALGNASSVSSSYNVTAATTLTAKTKTNKLYMQNLAYSSCTSTPTTVYDSRDGKAYTVQRLKLTTSNNDGLCWMLDNLQLDIAANKANITSSNTNANDTALGYLKNGGGSSPYTTNAAANTNASTWSGDIRYTQAMYNIDNANYDASYGNGTHKSGYYYNYCAASAGSYCYAKSSAPSNTNASQDICPAGWQMPAGDTSTYSYQKLYEAYGSNAADFKNALHVGLSGNFSGGIYYQGSDGYFWASTYRSNNNMRYLSVIASSVYPQNSNYRSSGFSVRCVLKATS